MNTTSDDIPQLSHQIPFDSSNTDDVLDGWNTSAVTTMRSAFEGCAAMEGSIKEWDVSNVKDMSLMVRSFDCLSASLRLGDASLLNTIRVNTSSPLHLNYLSFFCFPCTVRGGLFLW